MVELFQQVADANRTHQVPRSCGGPVGQLEAPGLSTSMPARTASGTRSALLLPPQPRGPVCKGLGAEEPGAGPVARYEPAEARNAGAAATWGPSSTRGRADSRPSPGPHHFRAACGEGSQARGSDQTKAGILAFVSSLVGPTPMVVPRSRHATIAGAGGLRPWSPGRGRCLPASLGSTRHLGGRRARRWSSATCRLRPGSHPCSRPALLRRSGAGVLGQGIAAEPQLATDPKSAGLAAQCSYVASPELGLDGELG
jgi:hypothetical protein